MSKARKIILVICIAALVLSLGMIGTEYYLKWREEQALIELSGVFAESSSEVVSEEEPDESTETTEITVEEKRYLEKLMEENPDTVGFLRINGTKICYPVMSNAQNNEYYLRRDFDKNYSISGMPFLDNRCDRDSSANLLIYGHHIKNGTMFQNLTYYENPSFYELHPQIEFFTGEEHRTYQIFAVFKSQIYDAEEDVFKYYKFFDADTKEAYDDYVANCKALSLYDIDITPEYGQQLITLSTCSYHVTNGRFVVVGVNLDD